MFILYCSTKHVSMINLCLPQSLFSAVVQNPTEKSHRLFVEGNRASLITRLANRNMSSLQHTVGGLMCIMTIKWREHTSLETQINPLLDHFLARVGASTGCLTALRWWTNSQDVVWHKAGVCADSTKYILCRFLRFRGTAIDFFLPVNNARLPYHPCYAKLS